MSLNLHFSDSDWQRIREDYTAWWEGALDRPLIAVTHTPPSETPSLPRLSGFIPIALQDMSVDELLDCQEECLSARRFYGDALPSLFINFGAGFLAAPLGSPLLLQPETIWFEEVEDDPAELANLDIHFDESNRWWRTMLEVTEKATARWGHQVAVSYTDLGGNLDILASLRGSEKLLMDCMDAPEVVAEKAVQITEIWLAQHRTLHELIAPTGAGFIPWAPTWAPGKTYMLQSDFSYMISPEMFGRFIMPDLRRCCDELDYAFYHLDGPGEIPHLPQLLSIENLRGVQWIPGSGNNAACDWDDVLGPILDAGKRCQIFCTFSEAMRALERFGGKGFLLACSPDDPNATEEDIQAFIEKAQSM